MSLLQRAYLAGSFVEPPDLEEIALFEISVVLLLALLAAAAFYGVSRRRERAAGRPAPRTAATDAPLVPDYVPVAEAVDVADVVARMGDPLERALNGRVRVRVEAAARLPAARTDRAQLELMVAHLVAFASRGTPDGGTVTIRVLGSAESADPGPVHGVVVEVEGSSGLDPAGLSRLFEPLSSGGAPEGALLLELATVRALVYHNHGTMHIEAPGDDRVRVAIVLPKMPDATPDPRRFAARGSERILIVEDENAVRALVRRTLQSGGYAILEAADPLIALEILEKGDEHVDLLLSDILMPHMRGTELVRRVRERWPLVRILYMSGFGHDRSVMEEVDRDGAALVAKPFTPNELLAAVRKSLDSLPGPGAGAA